MKRTDFEPGKVAFSLRVGEGLSSFPADRPGLQQMLGIALGVDGLKAHDVDELRRVLAGKAVSVAMTGDSSALTASGTTTAEDLKLQLDLLAARLTATAWRPETQAQWAGVAPILAKNIRSAPIQVFVNALNYTLAGNDARLGLGDAAALSAISLDDLRAAVQPQLASGSLALGLVGDFDPEAAIAAVSSTLGTLPTRSPRKEDWQTGTPVTFTADRSVHRLTHDGAADQGAIALSWPTDDNADLKDDITRDVLAAAMGLRLTDKLREELGASYSPEAFSMSHSTYPDFGHITAFATVSPESMDEVAEAMEAIAAEMAATPISADLLDRARNPIREGFERAETQNSSWLGPVAMAQSRPDLLDRRRQRLDVLNAITPEDIRAAGQAYLAGSDPVEIRVVPNEGDPSPD